MTHHRLANAMKLAASSMDGQTAHMKAARITSVGPDGTTAKIAFLDDPAGTPIGWLPIGQAAIGANAVISPPNINDLVMAQPHEGDAENWVVTHRLFDTSHPPPNSPATSAPIKSGELAIIMNGGGYIHFTNDGTIHSGGGKWHHDGAIEATGEITRGVGTGDSVTLGQHTHTQGSDSHGDSEVPVSPPTAGT